jgi:hypothetical protein
VLCRARGREGALWVMAAESGVSCLCVAPQDLPEEAVTAVVEQGERGLQAVRCTD